MRLALFQPDIPPNTGTMLRMAACLDVPVDVIEPCGFPFSIRSFRRAGLDYLDEAMVERHLDWDAFRTARGIGQPGGPRLVALTTKGAMPHHRFRFRPDDILLVGQESVGLPPHVHEAADARLRIPMRPDLRSLNVAVAAAMVLAEALRQTDGWPADHTALSSTDLTSSTEVKDVLDHVG